MREHARRQRWTVTQEFIEPGFSAWQGERPTFKALLERCRQEPRVEVVLIHKIDRFARNLMEHLTFRALLRQHNVRLASVVENIDESAAGLLLENIMAAMAEHYSRNLSEEAKKGMRQKVERGGWPHKPPLGYQAVRDSEGRSKVEPHPVTGPLMRQAFDLYASGFYSVRELARELAPKGLMTAQGKSLPQSHLHVLLRNPFYTGRLPWKGDVYAGNHEALVTSETFDRVQRQLASQAQRGSTRYASLEFWLKGIAYCAECGTKMTAERHGKLSYYRCLANARSRNACRAPYSNADRVHQKLKAVYKALPLSAEMKCLIVDTAEGKVRTLSETLYKERSSAVMSKTKLMDRQVKAAEAYASGEMPKDAYIGLTARLSRELAGLDEQVRLAGIDSGMLISRLRDRLSAMNSVFDLHSALTARDQGRLARAAFDRIGLRGDNIADVRVCTAVSALLVAGQDAAPHSRNAESVDTLTECAMTVVGLRLFGARSDSGATTEVNG